VAFTAVLLLSVKAPENVAPDCVFVHLELQVSVMLCDSGLTTTFAKVTVPVHTPESEGNTGAAIAAVVCAAGADGDEELEQPMSTSAHSRSRARFISSSFGG